jgi:type IV pilus assembly protein PilO
LRVEVEEAEEKVKRLDALIAENKLLKEKLATLRKQLPQEKEVSVLLKQISELGLRSGLDIILWKPKPKKSNPEGLYVEIPVQVEVKTEYHQLGTFFSHISRLQRLVNISNINLVAKQREKEKFYIDAKFEARTFASVDTVPAPAATPQTGGKK